MSGIILFNLAVFYVNAEEQPQKVYLGGQSFGVKFYSDGVIIINLENYYDGIKYVCPAKESGLKINDIITEANGKSIKTNEELSGVLSNCNGEEVSLKIKRNNNIIEKKITPVKNTAGMYLIGAWIRDSCAGIGTITYYDAKNNYFAALGHGICDNDTSYLMPLEHATVLSASISGVSKSISGKAGSLNGYFKDETLGNLTKNTPIGIFGTPEENYSYKQKQIEIAQTNEIKAGKASILTTIKGNDVEEFEIEITRICNKNKDSNENFIIRITDDRLLEECGGIVQGMSGSPIIQNGKLVGAVTHVFLNKPQEGFGIAIQNMVSEFIG